MKENKKSLAISTVAFVTLGILFVLGIVVNVLIVSNKTLASEGFPGAFTMLFDYGRYNAAEHAARFRGQVISNCVAYLFALLAVVGFILSFVIVKNDKVKRVKSVILSLGLLIPATIGLTGGIVNFFGEGFIVLTKIGGNSIMLALLLLFLFLLDLIYVIFAFSYIFSSFAKAAKGIDDRVQKKEISLDETNGLLRQILAELREIKAKQSAPVVYKEVVKEEVKKEPVPVVEEEVEEADDEEESSPLIKGPRKPRVPFAKKMLKADIEIKERYNELKNEFLSYGMSSRVSISGDTFRLHRKPYAMISLVGKTLKVYYALRLKDYENSPIPVEDASDKSKYVDIPVLLRVKSDLATRRAKELFKDAAEKDGVAKEKVPEDKDWIKDLRSLNK